MGPTFPAGAAGQEVLAIAANNCRSGLKRVANSPHVAADQVLPEVVPENDITPVLDCRG